MTFAFVFAIISLAVADVAHLVERHLAKVEVASSSLVIRSITASLKRFFVFSGEVIHFSLTLSTFLFLKKKKPSKSDGFIFLLLFKCGKDICDSCKVILIKESDFECTAFLAFFCDNSCFSAEGVIERKLNLIKECVS